MSLDPVWGALSPAERDVFERIVYEQGQDAWKDIPALRALLPIVVVNRAAAELVELPRAERWQAAAEAFGLDGRSLLRTWYRWQEAAVRQSVTRDDDAA